MLTVSENSGDASLYDNYRCSQFFSSNMSKTPSHLRARCRHRFLNPIIQIQPMLVSAAAVVRLPASQLPCEMAPPTTATHCKSVTTWTILPPFTVPWTIIRGMYLTIFHSNLQSLRASDSNSNPRDCHHSDTAVMWKCQGKCRRSKNKAGGAGGASKCIDSYTGLSGRTEM